MKDIEEILNWVREQKDISQLHPEIDDSDVVDCGYSVQHTTDLMNDAYKAAKYLFENCEGRWGSSHSNTRKVKAAFDLLDDLHYTALPAKEHREALNRTMFGDRCIQLIHDKSDSWNWNNDQTWDTIHAITDDGIADKFFGKRLTKKMMVELMNEAKENQNEQ